MDEELLRRLAQNIEGLTPEEHAQRHAFDLQPWQHEFVAGRYERIRPGAFRVALEQGGRRSGLRFAQLCFIEHMLKLGVAQVEGDDLLLTLADGSKARLISGAALLADQVVAEAERYLGQT